MTTHRGSGTLPETFCISKRILVSPPKTPVEPAQILQLPAAVLKLIFQNIRRPADQIKFALCCKTIAKVARTTKLNTTIIVSPKKPSLRAYNTTDLKQELQCWESLRKCKTCKKWLPKQRIWTMKDGVPVTKLKRVDWMWAVKDWMDGGPMCPRCRIEEYYEPDSAGWLQCRPEGFAKVTMFWNAD